MRIPADTNPYSEKVFARINNLLPRYNVDAAIWAEFIAWVVSTDV